MDREVEKVTIVKGHSVSSSEFDFCVDVFVRLTDGNEYKGAFGMFRDFAAIFGEIVSSDNRLPIGYYKILNTVVVQDLSEESMESVINQMIDAGDFQLVFKSMNVL